MLSYYDKIIESLNASIKELTIELNSTIPLAEAAIELTTKSLFELKQVVLKNGFKTEQEEINFFKYFKPNIVSKLIYYNSIYKIETKKPTGDKAIKKHLQNELAKLKRYFDDNLEFYKYYRTNSTHLDNKYFVRGKHDIKLSLDTYYFEADHNFSTSHDYKVAKIIANDLIQVYLENERSNIAKKNKNIHSDPISWTSSKTALIELIYALHSQSVFNNGNVDIKAIAKTFENALDIDLGDFYHTYLELRNRKINPTKFLDSLRESLIRKMDE